MKYLVLISPHITPDFTSFLPQPMTDLLKRRMA